MLEAAKLEEAVPVAAGLEAAVSVAAETEVESVAALKMRRSRLFMDAKKRAFY